MIKDSGYYSSWRSGIASDAVDASFRDHVKEEAGQLFRVLPICRAAITELDQGREAQLRHPRLGGDRRCGLGLLLPTCFKRLS